jgi:hypothetical protein
MQVSLFLGGAEASATLFVPKVSEEDPNKAAQRCPAIVSPTIVLAMATSLLAVRQPRIPACRDHALSLSSPQSRIS